MEDLISRQAVLDALRARFGVDFDYGKWWSSTHVLAAIESVPSVTPQEPCEDAISREAAMEAIEDWFHSDDVRRPAEVISCLASVNSQPKIGYWEWMQYGPNPNIGNWYCSECRRTVSVGCVNKNEKGGILKYKYCPKCGARMEEAEE